MTRLIPAEAGIYFIFRPAFDFLVLACEYIFLFVSPYVYPDMRFESGEFWFQLAVSHG